jgi:hypothetical protein
MKRVADHGALRESWFKPREPAERRVGEQAQSPPASRRAVEILGDPRALAGAIGNRAMTRLARRGSITPGRRFRSGAAGLATHSPTVASRAQSLTGLALGLQVTVGNRATGQALRRPIAGSRRVQRRITDTTVPDKLSDADREAAIRARERIEGERRAALRAEIAAIPFSQVRELWASRRDDFLRVAGDPENRLDGRQMFQIWLRYWMDQEQAAHAALKAIDGETRARDPLGYVDKRWYFDHGKTAIFGPDYERASQRLNTVQYLISEIRAVYDWLDTWVSVAGHRVTFRRVNEKALEIVKAKEWFREWMAPFILLALDPAFLLGGGGSRKLGNVKEPGVAKPAAGEAEGALKEGAPTAGAAAAAAAAPKLQRPQAGVSELRRMRQNHREWITWRTDDLAVAREGAIEPRGQVNPFVTDEICFIDGLEGKAYGAEGKGTYHVSVRKADVRSLRPAEGAAGEWRSTEPLPPDKGVYYTHADYEAAK